MKQSDKNTDRGKSGLRSDLSLGYLIQVTSLVLLLVQHFILPLLLGLRAYGEFVSVVGTASLLSIAFDHGYNLLTIRKPSIGCQYLRVKYLFLAVTTSCVGLYFLISRDGDAAVLFFSAVFYAVIFVRYTYLIHLEIAVGRMRNVLALSLVNGLLLVASPTIFYLLNVPVYYAPALAGGLSLTVASVFLKSATAHNKVRSYSKTFDLPLRYLGTTFVRQSQLAMGTIVDGVIVWGGVVAISLSYGFEQAAIYRITMSVIALMTQVIPMPKQVLLKAARHAIDVSWAGRFFAALALIGVLQALLVYFVGRPLLATLFPDNGIKLYEFVLLLAPVPALKATFELQTVLFDYAGRLSTMAWRVLLAATAAAAMLWALNGYAAILVFYAILCLLCAPIFSSKRNEFIKGANRRMMRRD
jgi:hypothetical protein